MYMPRLSVVKNRTMLYENICTYPGLLPPLSVEHWDYAIGESMYISKPSTDYIHTTLGVCYGRKYVYVQAFSRLYPWNTRTIL